VSSMTGAGIPEFFAAVAEKKDEFNRDYKPELERRRKVRDDEKEGKREKELGKLLSDLNMEHKPSGSSGSKIKAKLKEEPETVSDMEDADNSNEEDEDEEDGGMVDPDEEDVGEDNDEEGDGGLKQRYQQAVKDQEGPTDEDFSFAKYIHKANIG